VNALACLISALKDVCAGLPDRRKGQRRDGEYSMADIGLSAFSVFLMGSPSFLAHQRALEEGQGRSNCQTLFGMTAIPSDAYIRLMLDGASPAAFDPMFFQAIETEGVLAPFQRLGGRTLIALDGTEHFCSRKIHCRCCSTRRRSDGGTEYLHSFLGASIVAPGKAGYGAIEPSSRDGPSAYSCPRPCENDSAGHRGARLLHAVNHGGIKDSRRPLLRFYYCVLTATLSVFTQPGP